MKEDQINSIPFRPHPQPLLSSDKREIIAQFQQELLDAPDKRIFEFRFRIFIFEIQELENERISHLRVGGQSLIFDRR